MTNNILVHFAGDESLIGQIVTVHLDECKGFTIWADLSRINQGVI